MKIGVVKSSGMRDQVRGQGGQGIRLGAAERAAPHSFPRQPMYREGHAAVGFLICTTTRTDQIRFPRNRLDAYSRWLRLLVAQTTQDIARDAKASQGAAEAPVSA